MLSTWILSLILTQFILLFSTIFYILSVFFVLLFKRFFTSWFITLANNIPLNAMNNNGAVFRMPSSLYSLCVCVDVYFPFKCHFPFFFHVILVIYFPFA